MSIAGKGPLNGLRNGSENDNVAPSFIHYSQRRRHGWGVTGNPPVTDQGGGRKQSGETSGVG